MRTKSNDPVLAFLGRRTAHLTPLILVTGTIDIQKLQPSCLEPFYHDIRESLHQLVSQVVVFFRLRAKAFSIQGNGACSIQRASVETPAIWRNQPRPSQYVPFPDSLDHDGPGGGRYFQGYFPFANHVELVSFFAFVKEQLAGFEAHVRCASHDELKVLRFKTLQEWMLSNYWLKCLQCHACLLSLAG